MGSGWKERLKKRRAPQVGLIALGCPKNVVDAERLLGRFLEAGYEPTTDPAQADLLVVNTCGFKADAEAESRQAIAEMAALKAAHPGKRLIVAGCLAQRYGAQLQAEIPQIDLLAGTTGHDHLLERLAIPIAPMPEADFTTRSEVAPRLLTTPPHTAYLKIAEGCNNPCTFCIIPQLRGPFRSRPLEEIVAEAEALAAGGVRELIIVSQDTTLYGRDLLPRLSLVDLLARLEPIPGVRWIRLMYLYPTMITDSLLDHVAASDKVLPYFDLPLQHAHAEVLKRMQRAERPDDLERLVGRIRQRMPEAVLRSVFIVGFPGESDAEFAQLQQFMAATRFDHVGIFAYSDEREAAAYHLPDKIPAEVAQARRAMLMEMQQTISREKLAAQVGRSALVLVDGIEQGRAIGRTRGQALEVDGITRLEGRPPARVGSLVPVVITGSTDYDLRARVAGVPVR
ncbi:MAG: 30S ribosomal protein S12 methylthiotransferase RimO [Magnetococcales bacterium]|nr:30S ribosomal protein S12 methylthiotransferase RimO [Magnetococcales bacterium]NGZ05092.1 30S ribosomal protein S12 methylthiotransferase RimO [Magnetococcales bacterium]